MSIPKKYVGRYIYHMTHMKNLKSIFEKGLLSTNLKEKLKISHVNIANEVIQIRRDEMIVNTRTNTTVHDYVPFYFCSRSPMLLGLLNKKNIDQQYMVFLAIKIEYLGKRDVFYSSASANTTLPPTFFNNPSDLDQLDWQLMDDNTWGYTDQERKAKTAEALIPNKLLASDIGFIVVWNDCIKKEVQNLLTKNTLDIDVRFEGYQLTYNSQTVSKYHYYTKFFTDATESLITGPGILKHEFDCALKQINKLRTNIQAPKFEHLEEALIEIGKDFSCITELGAIQNLETCNPSHWQNVGCHSKGVVKELISLEEFQEYNIEQQEVLKVAAYLHDIGKAGSPKDENGKQKVDNDHPALALPLMKRILAEDFRTLSKKVVRRLLMLVTYHDLIGDIIAKDRSKEELINLIKNIHDFNMLVSISKADVLSLIPNNTPQKLHSIYSWYKNIEEQTPNLKKMVKRELAKNKK